MDLPSQLITQVLIMDYFGVWWPIVLATWLSGKAQFGSDRRAWTRGSLVGQGT